MKTPVAVENFAGYHDIKYMFATPGKEQGEKTSMIFSGSKNSYVAEPGLLLACAAALSAEVMKMPEEKRGGAAAVLMQLMELSGKKKRGQNGEILTKKDVEDFCTQWKNERNSLKETDITALKEYLEQWIFLARYCKSFYANGIEKNMQGIDKGKCAAELRTISNQIMVKQRKLKNVKTTVKPHEILLVVDLSLIHI